MEGRTDEPIEGTDKNYLPLWHSLYARGIMTLGFGGGVTSYIWHCADVRVKWPLSFSAARYMIGPLFSTKSI